MLLVGGWVGLGGGNIDVCMVAELVSGLSRVGLFGSEVFCILTSGFFVGEERRMDISFVLFIITMI